MEPSIATARLMQITRYKANPDGCIFPMGEGTPIKPSHEQLADAD
jgi:hypothetical protein